MFEESADSDGDSGKEESGCGYVGGEYSDSLGFFQPPDSSSDSGDEVSCEYYSTWVLHSTCNVVSCQLVCI